MRLARDVPGVMQAIETGKLSLSAASQVQHFFKNEQKQGKVYTPEQKAELTQKLEGKSRRDCERELLKISPESGLTQKYNDKQKQITPTQTEIRFLADEKLMAKLEKLKGLLAHHGNLGFAELVEKLADQALKKFDLSQAQPPLHKEHHEPSVTPPAVLSAPSATILSNLSSGQSSGQFGGISGRPYIKVEDRRIIWKRAAGCCEYVAPQSKRRCASNWALEIDHIIPLAKGGKNEQANYRLVCRSHNQWFAILALGAKKMGAYIPNIAQRARP